MQTRRDIEQMADTAKRAAGWEDDGTYRPLGDGDTEKERDDRSYAEGVEAGLRWATNAAGEPFPR